MMMLPTVVSALLGAVWGGGLVARPGAPRGPPRTKERANLLVSNPAADRNASPTHTADQAAREALAPWSTVPVGVVHGDWLGGSKGVLPAPAQAGIVAGAGYHGRGAGVRIVEVGGVLLAALGGGRGRGIAGGSGNVDG